MPKPYDVRCAGAFEPRLTHGATDARSSAHELRAGNGSIDGARASDLLFQGDAPEAGRYHGMLPAEDPPAQHGRANRFALPEHVRYAVRQSERCFFCNTKPFEPPPSARNVRAWLEAERPALWNQVRECFRQQTDGFALVPVNWLATIRADVRAGIARHLHCSRLDADHMIPVAILKLLDGAVPQHVLDFGGRELAVPACVTCGRARSQAGMEAPHVLLDRWIEYYFEGNRIAAGADPRWPMVERLVCEAYKIASDLRGLQRGTLTL